MTPRYIRQRRREVMWTRVAWTVGLGGAAVEIVAAWLLWPILSAPWTWVFG